MIEYRPAQESDIESLVELWWLMQDAHTAYCPTFYKNKGADACKKLSRDHLKSVLAKKDSMIHVATAAGTPVGVIVANFENTPPVYETRQKVVVGFTVVHPAHRRAGIFRGLLGCVEEKAKAAGVRMIELYVDHENPARLAYEKTGFRIRQHKMVKWI